MPEDGSKAAIRSSIEWMATILGFSTECVVHSQKKSTRAAVVCMDLVGTLLLVPKRCHLGGVSPNEFEAAHHKWKSGVY